MPIEVVWSPLALARLREIKAYVSQDKPEAAEWLAIRIVALVEGLRQHPYLGRIGSAAGTRELVVGSAPYVIVYGIAAERIMIHTIWHAAQRK